MRVERLTTRPRVKRIEDDRVAPTIVMIVWIGDGAIGVTAAGTELLLPQLATRGHQLLQESSSNDVKIATHDLSLSSWNADFDEAADNDDHDEQHTLKAFESALSDDPHTHRHETDQHP